MAANLSELHIRRTGAFGCGSPGLLGKEPAAKVENDRHCPLAPTSAPALDWKGRAARVASTETGPEVGTGGCADSRLASHLRPCRRASLKTTHPTHLWVGGKPSCRRSRGVVPAPGSPARASQGLPFRIRGRGSRRVRERSSDPAPCRARPPRKAAGPRGGPGRPSGASSAWRSTRSKLPGSRSTNSLWLRCRARASERAHARASK